MHHLEDEKLLPTMQHGSRPSRLCISAVLNKAISKEIHRYLLCLCQLGATPTFIASLAETWEGAFHRIEMLYGISTEQYNNAMYCLLYGPGQGTTIGPLLWLLCFLLIYNSLSPEIPRIIMSSVKKMITVEQVGEAFVDDTSLGCNATETMPTIQHSDALDHRDNNKQQEQQAIQGLQTLGQQWE
jgi:hypothetical protein